MYGFIDRLMGLLLPQELEQFLTHRAEKLFSSHSIIIDELSPSDPKKRNEIFDFVQAYLMRPELLSSVQSFNYTKTRDMEKPTFTMAFNQRAQDQFRGIPLEWSLSQFEVQIEGNTKIQVPRFRLFFHKKHMDSIQSYLEYVTEKGAHIIFENRKRKIYSNSRDALYEKAAWSGSLFSHPSNFDTLALDPALKEEIMADLIKFIKGGEFYSHVGRAWKRGYLLYGPPGTGKASLIAAIANFLNFDIYELKLTMVMNNLELRTLLHSTSSKSVIVVGDVDCSLHLLDRKEKREENKEEQASTVSLFAVLNFVDGLWSSWAGERLMIFTTNYKENIDPALLRAGRMDKLIQLGFCQFEAFKILAKNYLGIDHDHELMEEVEQLLPGADITPAEVAEIFMSCKENVELGMRKALKEMKKRVSAVAKNKMEMQKKIEMEGKEDAAYCKKEEKKMKDELE